MKWDHLGHACFDPLMEFTIGQSRLGAFVVSLAVAWHSCLEMTYEPPWGWEGPMRPILIVVLVTASVVSGSAHAQQQPPSDLIPAQRAAEPLPAFDPSKPYSIVRPQPIPSDPCKEPATYAWIISCYASSIANSVRGDSPYDDLIRDEVAELGRLADALANAQVTENYAKQRLSELQKETKDKIERRLNDLLARLHDDERVERERNEQYWTQQQILEATREARDAAQQAADDAGWARFNPSWPVYCQRYDRDSMYCY
jgi:hypothetical protein